MKVAVQTDDKDTRDAQVTALSDKIAEAVAEKFGSEYAEAFQICGGRISGYFR